MQNNIYLKFLIHVLTSNEQISKYLVVLSNESRLTKFLIININVEIIQIQIYNIYIKDLTQIIIIKEFFLICN